MVLCKNPSCWDVKMVEPSSPDDGLCSWCGDGARRARKEVRHHRHEVRWFCIFRTVVPVAVLVCASRGESISFSVSGV